MKIGQRDPARDCPSGDPSGLKGVPLSHDRKGGVLPERSAAVGQRRGVRLRAPSPDASPPSLTRRSMVTTPLSPLVKKTHAAARPGKPQLVMGSHSIEDKRLVKHDAKLRCATILEVCRQAT